MGTLLPIENLCNTVHATISEQFFAAPVRAGWSRVGGDYTLTYYHGRCCMLSVRSFRYRGMDCTCTPTVCMLWRQLWSATKGSTLVAHCTVFPQCFHAVALLRCNCALAPRELEYHHCHEAALVHMVVLRSYSAAGVLRKKGDYSFLVWNQCIIHNFCVTCLTSYVFIYQCFCQHTLILWNLLLHISEDS